MKKNISSCDQETHLFYMDCALSEAQNASAMDEVPVGAVIVYQDQIIARGFNQTRQKNLSLEHAEIVAIRQASSYLASWRLLECTMYVTLEPCSMCAGALVLARLDRLVYALDDPKSGACGSVFDIVRELKLNHRLDVVSGVRRQESLSLLKAFFLEKRERAKAAKIVRAMKGEEGCQSG